jgi:nicotinamide riboside kinase
MAAFVIMTALVPTTGHRDLIQFALGINRKVKVFVCGRSFEPTKTEDRISALQAEFDPNSVQFFAIDDDDAPQEPGEWAAYIEKYPDHADNTFMGWWADQMVLQCNCGTPEQLVASEKYGLELAKALTERSQQSREVEFFPYDLGRQLNDVTGTDTRSYLAYRWRDILPQFRKHLAISVTLFGQECVGKTSLMGELDHLWNTTPEWAREYLELVGPKLTPEKMAAIHRGQAALQKVSLEYPGPITIRDTDLFSTIGYYRILGWEVPEQLVRDALALKSDLYIVLPDDIPFKEDPLRYGGGKRESTIQFWVDILEEFGLSYEVLPVGERIYKKAERIEARVEEFFNEKNLSLVNFSRN